jgi:hypothetical protein
MELDEHTFGHFVFSFLDAVAHRFLDAVQPIIETELHFRLQAEYDISKHAAAEKETYLDFNKVLKWGISGITVLLNDWHNGHRNSILVTSKLM